MKILPPKPFTYRGGNRAVLLLHGFTGSTADVRMLGRYLQKRGYTCHAPVYKGHGLDPKELIQTGPDDWWQDVLEGYRFLKGEGFEEIAVAGVSLGGLFSLKIGTEFPVKGIVSMSAPLQEKKLDDLYERVLSYAKGYKRIEGKDTDQIHSEIEELKHLPMTSLHELRQTILDVKGRINSISSPILIIQGCLDESLYKESAKEIFREVKSENKRLQWYERSGHLITLGEEREAVCEEIRGFLNSLTWFN